MNCPHCGGRVRLVAAGSRARHAFEMTTNHFMNESAASLAQVYQEPRADYISTPVRAPTLQSDVWVIAARAAISSVIVFAGGTALAYASGIPKPVMWSSCAGFVTLAVSWRNGLAWTRGLLHRVERITGQDIDGDGSIGEPPDIISPIPVYTPGTHRPDRNKPKVRLRPSERLIEQDKLCDYLQWAFVNGWTRDKAQSFGLGQREWPDVRDFVDRWGLWGTDDRPALDAYVDSLRKQ